MVLTTLAAHLLLLGIDPDAENCTAYTDLRAR